MNGLQDETRLEEQIAQQQASQRNDQDEASQAQMGAAVAGGDTTPQARADYEATLKKRNAKIAELEGEISQAAKTAVGTEALRTEMDELRRQGDEQRIGFELQIAGARNDEALTRDRWSGREVRSRT